MLGEFIHMRTFLVFVKICTEETFLFVITNGKFKTIFGKLIFVTVVIVEHIYSSSSGYSKVNPGQNFLRCKCFYCGSFAVVPLNTACDVITSDKTFVGNCLYKVIISVAVCKLTYFKTKGMVCRQAFYISAAESVGNRLQE